MQNKPAPRSKHRGLDLKSASVVLTDRELIVKFETYGRPDTKASFWLQVLDKKNQRLADIVIGGQDQPWYNLWHNNKRTFGRFEEGEYSTKTDRVVEARLIHKNRFGFSKAGLTFATSYHQQKKLVNRSQLFKLKKYQHSQTTTAAYLLTRYAEKIELEPDKHLALALALSESFTYNYATTTIKEMVIKDGIAMYQYGKDLASLNDLPFEATLAWSNRGFMWGGIGGFYLDKNQQISRESYNFMYLNPRLLKEVRAHLSKQGIHNQGSTQVAAEKIDKWALSKNKYRWKLPELKKWAKNGQKYFVDLYHDARKDVQAGRDKITKVNDKQIYYWAILSANFQWRHLRKHDFFYGPCGDVAAMSQLALKALGIADFGYFRSFNGEAFYAHTFMGFYDAQSKTFKTVTNQLPPANYKKFSHGYLQYSLPPLSDKLPRWQKQTFTRKMSFWASRRSPVQKMPFKKMKRILKNGISKETFAKMLYAKNQEVGPTSKTRAVFDL